jgi:sugar fermentation stimulation protein A
MEFAQALKTGVMVKRYKRFLADVILEDGTEITVHCPNSGSMKGCWQKGCPVCISDSGNLKRKYRHTLEMVHNGRCWIGINTHLANQVAKEAVRMKVISGLDTFARIRSEVPYGENSRVDLLGEASDGSLCFIEVKNVTLVEDGAYTFPDAITKRGTKHLEELIHCIENGHRAAVLFVIQRSDGEGFRPCHTIDPTFATVFSKAVNAGVEVYPCLTAVSPQGVEIKGDITPLIL